MSILADVLRAADAYDKHVEDAVRTARNDPKAGEALLSQWRQTLTAIPEVDTPTGLRVPAVALPDLDEPGAVARYLAEENLPGQFPFMNGAYPRMYAAAANDQQRSEEPTRLFAGLGLAEDSNARFRYLGGHQRSARLSTAFDGPTLYGMDSDADGALGKIGEGGVAIDTVDDVERLYAGFDLADPRVSVSMTISGPAPVMLAMYVAAAKRRFGENVVGKLRGTIQADVLKEVQAQNEMVFPIDAALRFLADTIEWTTAHMPRWYPVSVSGYHIAEAGATPVQQAAYTLANGLEYARLLRDRGLAADAFGPRLSFFLDCGLDVEYLVLARVCRKLWAIAMRDVLGATDPRAQVMKLHTQTSGRSLVAREFRNNLTRTAVELVLAYANGTNSCHSNAADEPFTTPSPEYARLAAHAQAILLDESGLFKHTTNLLGSSPGMRDLARRVESEIRAEWARLEDLGGVLGAVEARYQRSQIQAAAHRYETQIATGDRPIVGVNLYRADPPANVEVVRTPLAKQRKQIERLSAFKKRHARKAGAALEALMQTARAGENVFPALIAAAEVCSLGQMVAAMQSIVGRFRP
ncbi:MAG: methylmalonyl-CoA mutase family protein, partial [Phycisphaerae bacterium]